MLGTVDWSIVKSQSDPSVAYDLFLLQLQTCIAACTQQVNTHCAKNYSKIKPWITNSICWRIQRRNFLYKKVRDKPSDDKFKQYYIRFRNKLRNDIKLLKLNYYQGKFENATSNPKAT